MACLTLCLAIVTTAISPALAQRSNSYERSSARSTDKPGDFDYYALVLSWSPTHCATPQGRRDRSQCNRRDGRQYDFILHGLWPQYERGYPANCRTQFKPFVPNHTINSMMDIMPSKGLIIHEYRKHGTCSGMTPTEYYDASRKLFRKIRIPAAYQSPDQPQMVSPDQLKSQFVAVNKGLRRDMMSVVCRGSGNRLREVRFCFTRQGELRKCGRNENQRSLCSAPRMFVPPVRVSAAPRSTRPQQPKKPKVFPKSPLPMPRG
jgi:ribonuclease T2